jgi:hypothetical protein
MAQAHNLASLTRTSLRVAGGWGTGHPQAWGPSGGFARKEPSASAILGEPGADRIRRVRHLLGGQMGCLALVQVNEAEEGTSPASCAG